MRKLVTIEEVAEIKPIPNADAIEAAKIKDWWVVIKKGQFKVGDKAIYHEIDSFLPINPDYDFLIKGSKPKRLFIDGVEKEGIRLRTVKLRGQVSQGLLLPLKPELPQDVGTDVTELLGVYKYEAPIPVSISGEVKGSFPSFLPKTDEERIQNCGELLELHKGKKCYVASKLDGTSGTFYKYNNEFGVCSRNLELKEGTTIFWRLAKEYDLQNKIPDGFCVQGEVVGLGIQGNPLRLSKNELFIFNVYDIKSAKYLNYLEFIEFANNLGLKTVPIIDDNFVINHTVEELLTLANKTSPLNENVLQEGVVIRPLVEELASIGGILTRFSFKAISNEYLLNGHE